MTLPAGLLGRLLYQRLGQERLPETTPLPAGKREEFESWLRANDVTDLDHPESRYDYRGAFLAGIGREPGEEGHFPDTFKQHGHPSFSDESQYANDPANDPHWFGDVRLRPMGRQVSDATAQSGPLSRALARLRAAR